MHCSRSHDAVIRVYDEAGNVIETHEHGGEGDLWRDKLDFHAACGSGLPPHARHTAMCEVAKHQRAYLLSFLARIRRPIPGRAKTNTSPQCQVLNGLNTTQNAPKPSVTMTTKAKIMTIRPNRDSQISPRMRTKCASGIG